ncbi:MAG: hypothetical protein EHM59_06545 [Betaproteobacteria bacterium]|nr:MAG: hypothetical protein EHM59_06545 [Betaproteobacteria bacterium]
MSRTRGTYRRNSPEAAAHVIAALLARDGRLDWRELEFLDSVGTLQMLGVERGRFMAVLSRYLGECLGGMAAGRSAGAERFDAELDAIDDRTTQLILAALLLYLAEIDGVQAEERALVRRAWDRWNVTPQILEREMQIPLARSRTVHDPAVATA